jgi:Zn-dependent metalloprotease
MAQCQFCKSDIPSDATRCPHCTSFLDGEQPQVSHGQIVYILDKGLVTFAKFAFTILALFVTVGIFLYGINLNQLRKEMDDTSKEIGKTHAASQELDFKINRAQAALEKESAEIQKEAAEIDRDFSSAEKAANDANGILSRMKQAEELVWRTEQVIDQIMANAVVFHEGVAIAARQRKGLHRQIFDAKNTDDLPGDLVRKEGDAPVSDPVANEVYGKLEVVYRFFNAVFGRESVDDRGKTLVASIHYGQGGFYNTYWDGKQLVFGDGDGVIFKRFGVALDVVARELTFGVTQFTAALGNRDQPGSLSSSMSDVFGSMVKQWSLGQTVDQADWLIGAAIMAPDFKGRALRDMANPGTAFDDPNLGKDKQPGHMKDYVQTDFDNGGVHTNSGIPNRAFVLAAKAIGGHSWEKTGKIWYVTLTERLTGNADFARSFSR